VTVQIRVEEPGDEARIRGVVSAAFVDQPVVADLVDALRQSTAWRGDLSLLAEDDGRTIGYVLATRGWLDGPAALVDVLVLSPLAVVPERQRRGVGAALVNELLARTRQRGEPAMFLEGAPAYYRRFGFVAAGGAGFRRPSLRIPPAAFQMVRLDDGATALSGTLVYPEPFWAYDCVGLR
jgi:putative acetyltransferase